MEPWTEFERKNLAWDSVAPLEPAQTAYSRGLPASVLPESQSVSWGHSWKPSSNPRPSVYPGERERVCLLDLWLAKTEESRWNARPAVTRFLLTRKWIFAAVLRAGLCWRAGLGLVFSLCHLPAILFSSVLMDMEQFWRFALSYESSCWSCLYFSFHLALNFSMQRWGCVVSPHCLSWGDFELWSESAWKALHVSVSTSWSPR